MDYIVGNIDKNLKHNGKKLIKHKYKKNQTVKTALYKWSIEIACLQERGNSLANEELSRKCSDYGIDDAQNEQRI